MIADILNWVNTIPAWMESAHCTGGDIDMWFSSNPYEIAEAKRICQNCPARMACLRFAYEQDERHGVWGGLSPAERSKHVNKAKRGAA